MFQRDYIERMATQIAQVIAELLGYDTTDRLEYIDEVFNSLLDGDSAILLELDGQELIDFLAKEKGLQLTELELMANLFHQKGQTLLELKMEDLGMIHLQRALVLISWVDDKMDIFSMERRELLKELNNLVGS